MSIEKFTPDELIVRDKVKTRFSETEILSTPITMKENSLRLYQGKTPMWAPFSIGEYNSFMLDCDPENRARAADPGHGIDGYGVEWVWVKEAGGAMVKPGAPKCLDINEWEKYLTVPDPDTWDWEDCYNRNKHLIRDDRLTYISVPGCLFERLIAVMDFQYAAVALIDDDQKEGVHRFLRAVTDYRKKYYTLVKKWFDPDGVNFNDDWGSQRAEFFSRETAAEMLVPYVKESVACAHELGMYVDLHCCGFVEGFVPFFIEEGFDTWGGQPLNDKPKLKKMYPDSLVFTHQIDERPDASDEEIDAAVAKFMEEFGYDNRGFYGGFDPRYRRKVYEASRKNYDRLVAEGKAVV